MSCSGRFGIFIGSMNRFFCARQQKPQEPG